MAETISPARFPIEAIAVVPAPGLKVPNHFSFSQDDRQATYFLAAGEQAIQQLYALDTATGESSVLVAPPGGGVKEDRLSPEEELRRQRERNLATGLTHYSRAKRAERLLIPVGGDIYVRDGPEDAGAGARATNGSEDLSLDEAQPRQAPAAEGALRLVVESAGKPPALTPALSPDGEWVAYVQDAEVYVASAGAPALAGAPRQITQGARGTGKTNGLAEFIAQEEMARAEGFWWSPDSQRIAFTEVDERHIPLYRIMHQGKEVTGPEAEEAHHYPFVGAANALVRLAVVSAMEGVDPVWMDLDFGEEVYLARVFWWQDGSLGAITLNREQSKLYLCRFDIHTGKRSLVLQEESAAWINLGHKRITLLERGGFLWLSERSGFMHIYLYGADDTLVRQITAGDWVVDDIESVDEANERIYFTGNRDHPTECQLYSVSFAGDEPRRITPEPGFHHVTIDHACKRFIDVHSALDHPPGVTLRSLGDGSVLHTVETPPDPRVASFGLEPPEIVTLRNRKGTTLYGALYRPPERFGPGPYPTVIHVYGGPGPQLVSNQWRLTAALDLQYLRGQGFLVFRLDNRGSARRGLAFESEIKHRMGTVEVDDQVDGVRWLVEQGLADPTRVGIMGWSGGGYMTLMCLAKAADVFKVGVAGAPVTSQDGYDTCYTERYMGTPASNPSGYAESSVLNYVDQIKGKLLIVHGMIDENVHFRHTARLINALIRARKPYDLLIFPDERHMPRRHADRVYLNERTLGYFQQHL
ncbi:MAG TPA: DPP IV N-terminal domain-containing protein [Ktedonobacterales bacterium]|jgi:dipeptidyl-peptidase-4